MKDTFLYKERGRVFPTTVMTALILAQPGENFGVIARLLDVLRAKGILTGWDVCDVLGEGWEPCSSDAPPP